MFKLFLIATKRVDVTLFMNSSTSAFLELVVQHQARTLLAATIDREVVDSRTPGRTKDLLIVLITLFMIHAATNKWMTVSQCCCVAPLLISSPFR